MNEYLSTWASESDVEIHYVVMGDKDIPLPTEGGNLTVSTTGSRGILYGIVDVCNEIYGMAALPETSIVNDTLTIPIPTGRIVVFAQGKDVSVEYAEIEGDRLSPSSVQLMYAEKPHLSGNETWIEKGSPNDESLQGIVATFEPTDAEGFNAGEMMLYMDNAEYVEIYYEPYVSVETTLMDAGVSEGNIPKPFSMLLSPGDTVIDSNNTDVNLTKGTYYVSSRMMSPLTGEEIKPEDSENLIHDLAIDATLQYSDGEIVEFNGENKVELKAGDGTLETTSTVYANENDPDPSVITQKMKVTVDPVNWKTLFARFGKIALILAIAIAIVVVYYLHARSPRLTKGLAPSLRDKYNNQFNRQLHVEMSNNKPPFIGAETQELYMRFPRNYTSRVMPSIIKLRAVDKKGNMVIDNWSQLVDAANRNEVSGAIKIGSRDLKKVKQGEPSMVITTGTRITFVARRGSTETKMELRLK